MSEPVKIRRTVIIPGDNVLNIGQLRDLLNREDVPDSATVRTQSKPLNEADIVIWWIEELS